MATGLDSTISVMLVFGDTRLEVSFDPNGGLEALGAEVETQLELHPESFSIADSFGKVDDSVALQRALDMTTGETLCVLEVHETRQGQKMREMEAKINMLVARCPVVDSVLMSLEERSSVRFDKLASALQGVEERAALKSELALAKLEELDSKVNKSIAPLLQSVALQEMELKANLDSMQEWMLARTQMDKMNSLAGMKQKLESLEESARVWTSMQDVEMQISGVERQMKNGMAPMLQSMALSQMDMKVQLDGLHLGAEKDQQTETSMNSGSIQELSEQLKAVQAEMKSLSATRPAMTALAQDLLGNSSKQLRNDLGGDEWNDNQFSSFAYSKKSHFGMNAAVPFARLAAPRQLDRMQGSCSLPYLPSVK